MGAWVAIVNNTAAKMSIQLSLGDPAFFFFNFLLDYRFWGTCAEHARQLRRYTQGSVLSFLLPFTHIWLFSPGYPSPPPPPTGPPLFPPIDPSV